MWYKDQNYNEQISLTSITDASFANQGKLKPQLGLIYIVNVNIIDAKSSRSTVTCSSSTEAELYAVAKSVPRLNNLNLLLKTITGRRVNNTILTDSKTYIPYLKTGDISRIKSKFYDTKSLRLKEDIEDKQFAITYVPTAENITDVFKSR